jgi:uncharacterized protein (DUF2237 family)
MLALRHHGASALACLWFAGCQSVHALSVRASERSGDPQPTTALEAPSPIADRERSLNVVDGALAPCPSRHRTGFYRDGFCNTGPDDRGVHVVCARVTDAFLRFTASRGNDLVTPRGDFAGLRDGDHWCLCAGRWEEARREGVAPPVVLEATHRAALRTIARDALHAAQIER